MERNDPNNGFCALPFVQYSTYNGGRYRLCCMAKEPQDIGKPDVNQEELGISGTWNHEYIRDVRQRMAAGEWLPECVECERLERNGIVSSRQWENEVWEEVVEEVIEQASTNEWHVEQPLQFDFRLGNLCNLKCQMCNHEASHLVSVERGQMIEQGLGLRHQDWTDDNIADKKLALLQPGIEWESFEKMLPKAQKIKMIGGEPTVSPDMFKLLDMATEMDVAKNIELSFYTNITNMQDKWLEQLGQFKKVIVNCSLEGSGAMNDYLRPPSKWDSVWKNFDKLHQFSKRKEGKRIKTRITTVNQITNALHIVPFWRFLHEYQLENPERGIGMSTNQLVEPNYYSMAYSPQWLRDQQKEQVLEFLEEIKDSEYFEDFEEPLMELVYFGEDDKHQYNEHAMRKYVEVTENYDAFRMTDVRTVSPEFDRIKRDLDG
jgi:sulfatase maturation enzyme AslB (radical SAM superfamily)